MTYRVKKVEHIASANPSIPDAYRLHIEDTGSASVDVLDVPFVDGQPPTQAEVLDAICTAGFDPNDLGNCP